MYKCNRTRNIRRVFNVTETEKELLDKVRKEYKVSYVELLMIAVKTLKEGEK